MNIIKHFINTTLVIMKFFASYNEESCRFRKNYACEKSQKSRQRICLFISVPYATLRTGGCGKVMQTTPKRGIAYTHTSTTHACTYNSRRSADSREIMQFARETYGNTRFPLRGHEIANLRISFFIVLRWFSCHDRSDVVPNISIYDKIQNPISREQYAKP